MCWMCSYRVEPAARGARLVVSDRGDILSPTTAPAVMGRESPSPWAMMTRTTPMVPMDPQDVPVQVDITAQIIKDVT